MSVHVGVEPGAGVADVCHGVREAILQRLPHAHVTVQPERERCRPHAHPHHAA